MSAMFDIASNGGKAKPTIATTPSASASAGGNIRDSARMTVGTSPTGSLTFTLFGPVTPLAPPRSAP
jgi:hypothetical protein